ncbi:MAG TPA: hypothetical protein VGC58_02540, partial [Candidatus Paceibacterota bacterium]
MHIFSDLYYILKGRFFKFESKEYSLGFIGHARWHKDRYRKYAFFKFFPKSLVIFFMNNFWPITLSKVTGVYSLKDKKEVHGYVLGITATSDYLVKNRKQALRKIRNTLYLARGKGAKIVGLGGLTSSLSGGGTMLLDIDINITTGHAYTAYNVTQNFFKLVEIRKLSKEQIKIAVVGA